MTRKGVLVSINSDSAEHARRLNTEAAKTMKYGGLTEDEALAIVTINPAKQLRIDNRVGSLEAGKDADLVIWNHHPLSTYAIAERVYIDGTVYYDRQGEEGRLTALKKEKSSLAAAEGGTRPADDQRRRRTRARGEERQGGRGETTTATAAGGNTGSTPAQATQTAKPAAPAPARSSRSPTRPSTRSRGRRSRTARS